MKPRITIFGAGNIGCVIASKFSQKYNVCLYISNAKPLVIYDKQMRVYQEDTDSYYSANIDRICFDIKEAVEYGDVLVITYPAFLFEKFSKIICPLLTKKHHLLFVPGSGGAELFFKEAIAKGASISGLQRVHSVARIIEPGKLVKESGIRRQLNIASIPNSINHEMACVVSDLYSLPVHELPNYLNVTLVNSNPILHTSRLYTIFKDYPDKINGYKSLPLFYEEWDLESSNLLVNMDKELFGLFHILESYGLPITEIEPILEHYESKDDIGMTNKINSINSLKGLGTPSIKLQNGLFVPDLSSRYFTADFPFGLDILTSISSFFNNKDDNLVKVSDWYHHLSKVDHPFNIYSFFNNIYEFIAYYKQ